MSTTETYIVPTESATGIVSEIREHGHEVIDIVTVVRTDETTTLEVTWATHPRQEVAR